MYSVHIIYLTDKNRNLSEPADGWSPWRPSISPASGSKMLQEWLGCLRGSLVAAIRAKTPASAVWLCNGEQAYVQLCCPECFFCWFFFPPSSAQSLASLIPPQPCTRILFGPSLFSLSTAFSPEKLCSLLFFQSFFVTLAAFSWFLCWIVVGTSGRWQNPRCAARFLWLDIFTMELFSIQNKSALSIVPPPNRNTFISAGNFCTFSHGLLFRLCNIVWRATLALWLQLRIVLVGLHWLHTWAGAKWDFCLVPFFLEVLIDSSLSEQRSTAVLSRSCSF